MLERIALHQTRLRTPGLGLDGKGVALGARGVVLLPSLERLVAWLAIYTRERSLDGLLPTLTLAFVRSKLGTREVTIDFAAESSDRMDRVADVARLVGGFTFTGTSRHFVQYRDAGAPFGYDAPELLAADAALAVYHDQFSQLYDVERTLDLKALLLRLELRLDPRVAAGVGARLAREGGPRFVVAETGVGQALVQYFARSRVEADVCVAEWPTESAFDDGPARRMIFRVPELPGRMHALTRQTPGMASFFPSGAGVAVEEGYKHPVELRACPVFDPNGLTLLRGRGEAPLVLARVPPMGPVAAFARIGFRADDAVVVARPVAEADREGVRVPLALVPSASPWRNVTASLVPRRKFGLLRKLAYALPATTIARTTIALTDVGAFLRAPAGAFVLPVGVYFTEFAPGLFVSAGYAVSPAVSPDVLARALSAEPSRVVFVTHDGPPVVVDAGLFGPLESALLERAELTEATALAGAAEDAAPLDAKLPEIKLGPLGAFALSSAEAGATAKLEPSR